MTPRERTRAFMDVATTPVTPLCMGTCINNLCDEELVEVYISQTIVRMYGSAGYMPTTIVASN